MNPRTIREFPSVSGLWATVDQWARSDGFFEVEASPTRKLLQKGRGFLVAPMMVEIVDNAGRTRLQVWVQATFFARLLSLFILPAEMHVESGGFRGVLPRSIARNAANGLLVKLGQPPIP